MCDKISVSMICPILQYLESDHFCFSSPYFDKKINNKSSENEIENMD